MRNVSKVLYTAYIKLDVYERGAHEKGGNERTRVNLFGVETFLDAVTPAGEASALGFFFRALPRFFLIRLDVK